MKFLRSRVTTPTTTQTVSVAKSPVLEGWSETDLVAVYNAAPVRQIKAGAPIFSDLASTDSFFIVLEGFIQVVVKFDGHMGRPGMIRRGDCVAPLPKSPGLLYCADAIEPATVIEISPMVLNYLPVSTQLCIYKAAVASTSRINAFIRSVNGEMTSKNANLASYIGRRDTHSRAAVQSEKVRHFISNVPRLPAFATDIAMKLLQDTTSVQEVVDAIKKDPSTAGLVLRAVNSAQFGLGKKIETFYHACIILGFNNIYTLIMRDALQSTMPASADTQRIHTHSCLISLLCYEISLVSKDVQGQTATTLGLLHDVGKGIQTLMKNAHWLMDEYVDTLDSSLLGANLLRAWGLPDRLCQIVEYQHHPEFTPPAMIPVEYRREVGVLHLAHVLESMLISDHPAADSMIYANDYMAMLGITTGTPAQLLKERVIPQLSRNLKRVPQEIQALIAKACGNVQNLTT